MTLSQEPHYVGSISPDFWKLPLVRQRAQSPAGDAMCWVGGLYLDCCVGHAMPGWWIAWGPSDTSLPGQPVTYNYGQVAIHYGL